VITRAALIYNPESGRQRRTRVAQVEAARDALRAAGIEAVATPSRAAGSAGEQAREAIANGCDAVFACGGDGTVNEVLQGMVGSQAALGVIPLGTANALAADLRIPRDPAAAARAALSAGQMRVAVGQLSSTDHNGATNCRFFIVTAGIGADAHLVYTMTAAFKQRYGYAGYFACACRTWATHTYPPFEVEFTQPDGVRRREIISQLLAARITEFGGLMRRLVPGAALNRDVLRLALFKTPDRLRYLQYMTNVWLGRQAAVRDVELADAISLECRPLHQPCQDTRWRGRNISRRIYTEADGELTGMLPASINIVPDAVTLLLPGR
jgi:diacylglycerol kinase family enzyme